MNVYKLIFFLGFVLSIVWFIKSPGFEPLLIIITTLGALFKNNFFSLINFKFFPLHQNSKILKNSEYSFYEKDNKKLINPKIIQELEGFISDRGDEVTSINLINSNNSNKYFLDKMDIILDKNTKFPMIGYKNSNESYYYEYIGMTFSGIHIIRTFSWGGGSAVFENLLFLILQEDTFFILNNDNKIKKINRIILKKIGYIALGDRYNGNIYYKYGILKIGKNMNNYIYDNLYKKDKYFFIY